jgi:hydroxymethylbilane synthase
VTTAERPLRLGTRGSALALTQSSSVAAAITGHLGRKVELVEITTTGDRSHAAIEQLGGTGVFVTALRDALLSHDVDLAVHSYKDLPTAPFPGLTIAAVPTRADPRDVLVARDQMVLGELPPGSKVGTGSPRRIAQIRALGLGLSLVPVRGNVDTRLGKVTSGQLDAVVLAGAGLQRLDRMEGITELLDPLQILPAPAQGALAVECRSSDAALLALLSGMDDPDAHAAVTAERTLLATLEGGCSAPIGALAEVMEGDDGLELFLRASVTALDGSDTVRLTASGPATDAAGIGERLAAEMLELGAGKLMGTPR